MKRHLIATLAFGLALMTANAASAGPLEDGQAAYQRQDYTTAVKWYRLAAAQGDVRAQFMLGEMYQEGTGVLQDYKEAVKWYRLAAVQGDGEAQLNLGFMIRDGQGVARDYVRAHMWFNLSSISAKMPLNSMWAISGAIHARFARDKAAERMKPAQIAEAQAMARKCQASNFQQCD